MTAINRPVRRSVDNVDRWRGAILTLYPGGAIGVRLKRHRKEYFTNVPALYRLCVQRELEQQRAEKRKAKGTKVLVRRGRVS